MTFKIPKTVSEGDFNYTADVDSPQEIDQAMLDHGLGQQALVVSLLVDTVCPPPPDRPN